MAGSAHAALNLEVKAQIGMRDGQTARQRAQRAMHGPRDHARVPCGHVQAAKCVVARK